MHASTIYALRAAAALVATSAALMLSPMGTATADDTSSPGAPIIRTSERGVGMSGVGAVRPGTQIKDAHDIRIVAEGGNESAGAPTWLVRGNPASMPVVQVDDAVICSSGQRIVTKMLQCSR